MDPMDRSPKVNQRPVGFSRGRRRKTGSIDGRVRRDGRKFRDHPGKLGGSFFGGGRDVCFCVWAGVGSLICCVWFYLGHFKAGEVAVYRTKVFLLEGSKLTNLSP